MSIAFKYPGKLRFSWLAWHRWLGLASCFGILMWGLSGLSHPIMTRLQPSPAAFAPPPRIMNLQGSIPPQEVLASHGLTQLQHLSVINYRQQDFYRVGIGADSPARYFSAETGKELVDGDRLYAEQLAMHYTGLPSGKIHEARLITGFSDDYHAVNQLLPVWRVEFAGNGHLRAFIDTDQARLSTLVDDTRYCLTRLFRLGHNWSFAEGMPVLQVTLMALILGITLFSAGSGLYMYFSRRLQAQQRLAGQPLRRWHRRLGLLVALSTLLFASTGGFHLIMSFVQQRAAKPVRANVFISASQLSADVWRLATTHPLASIDLVTLGDKPLWLVRNAADKNAAPHAQVAVLAQEEHHHHGHHEDAAVATPAPVNLLAADGAAEKSPEDIVAMARIQATSYAQKPLAEITHAELVEKFGGEYGFVFKRLPVVKVQFKGADNPRYYIEPVSGELAVQMRDVDALEGWSFAYLHKWEFANYNKDFRDILVSLFVLGNIIVALMGLVMFSRLARMK
jgi:hypothetical protein